MEMVELSQKEIRFLLSLLDAIDFDHDLNISEIVELHAKLSASQIY